MNTFSGYHPAVMLTYFAAVIFTAMFAENPVYSLTAFLGGTAFSFMLFGVKKAFSNLMFYLGLFIILSLFNPLFSHNGVTPLFFINGSAFTLEAVFYGGGMALMLISVLMWFSILNEEMSTDKILFLFGKAVPKLAVTISMALRFIPLYVSQYKKTREVQKASGMFSEKSRFDRIKAGLRVLPAVISWALENSMETSQAMLARGYSGARRTSFSVFRFGARDVFTLIFIAAAAAVCLYGMISGKTYFAYYPEITVPAITVFSAASYAAYAALCALPFAVEVKEALVWKYSVSKI